MNISALATKTFYWILKGIQLQLFITLFSLPLLCAWGLPLSLLSPLGNLLFGPVLTLFLLVSSLIFFTELIGIPNQFLISFLTYISSYWLSIMHADTQHWLIGFVNPSYVVLFLLPLGGIFIMICHQTRTLGRSIVCLTFLIFSFWSYTWYHYHHQSRIIPIACTTGSVYLVHHNRTLILIDSGFMGSTLGACNFVQYTLIPQIIQHTGRTFLDHVIVLQPNSMTLKALESLMIKMPIGHLYIPYWNGSLSRAGLHAYGALKKMCTQANIHLTRIGFNTERITIDPTCIITIEPLPYTIQTGTISYSALATHTFIDNQDITLYSARYPHNLIK